RGRAGGSDAGHASPRCNERSCHPPRADERRAGHAPKIPPQTVATAPVELKGPDERPPTLPRLQPGEMNASGAREYAEDMVPRIAQWLQERRPDGALPGDARSDASALR